MSAVEPNAATEPARPERTAEHPDTVAHAAATPDQAMPYRELGLKAKLDAGMSRDEMFALLATDGMLVKRPILVTDDAVLVGFREVEWAAALL